MRGRTILVAVCSAVTIGAVAAGFPRAQLPATAQARLGVVSGVVVDDTSQAPIAGATVVVSGTTAVSGSTPPPVDARPWPSATTRADGSFDVAGVPPSRWNVDFRALGPEHPRVDHAQWLEIFPRDGHAAYHAVRAIMPWGATDVGAVALARPTAADVAWLARINVDRAAREPDAEPLIFDSVTLQTARYWARLMAEHAFFDHRCPPALADCTAFWRYETERGSPPSAQNLAYGFADWRDAQSGFMAETARCPDGGSWRSCAYDEGTGHYLNIMRASHWAGVAVAVGAPLPEAGRDGVPLPASVSYFAENFASPRALAGGP